MKLLTALLSAAATTPTAEPQIFFEPANFVKNLEYMGIGMLVIFVIITVIILATVVINKIFSNKNN